MSESRGQMESRLRDEGRWEAFEARRRALKEGGKTGSESYQTAVAEFSEDLRDEADVVRMEQLAEAAIGHESTLQQDLAWVYGNQLVSTSVIEAETVPSCGAVGLLQWARSRQGRDDFFKQILRGYARIEQPPEPHQNDEDPCGKTLDDVLAAWSGRGETEVGV